MNIKSILPACDVPVLFMDLTSKQEAGNYNPLQDTIVLCESMKKDLPICRDIVYIHELMHATGNKKRSLRRKRLVDNFKLKAYRVEECIAEAATMVILSKLGVLNKYSKVIPEAGFEKYYKSDIYIPWREVEAAVNHFKGEDVNFTDDLIYVREYLRSTLKIRVRDTYEATNSKTAI
jgi:hypothetical protein